MSKKELENLVKVGQLKKETFSRSEFDTYIRSGEERLNDALAPNISLSGKFLLGYSAAYSFSLAALRRLGYRPANRYVVFQCLPHSLGADVKFGAYWQKRMMLGMVLNMKEMTK